MKRAKSFLGQGWAFPPSFARDLNAVVMSAEDQNIQENLNILFSTYRGERLMNESYGTMLRSLVFENPDVEMYGAMRNTIRNAILLFEPRIKLVDIAISADPSDPGTVLVSVQYTIRTTNSRSNFVYPFHIIEGTNLIDE